MFVMGYMGALLHITIILNPGSSLTEEPLNGSLTIISTEEKKLVVFICPKSVHQYVTHLFFSHFIAQSKSHGPT